jgi:succinate dehydrogenase/fumarate reductase flavoprotein subunit
VAVDIQEKKQYAKQQRTHETAKHAQEEIKHNTKNKNKKQNEYLEEWQMVQLTTDLHLVQRLKLGAGMHGMGTVLICPSS